MDTDVLIFGGGVAGLWLLDELVRQGFDALLLEANRLGGGQTACCQGIIHGGLKYTLSGMLTPSARQIREMPALWRACLEGRRQPDLSGVQVVSDFCYLWRTESLRSRAGMLGAQYGLRVKPQVLAQTERPAVLADCRGTVARLDEQVIDPVSFLKALAQKHHHRLLKINAEGVRFLHTSGVRDFSIQQVEVTQPETGEELPIDCRWVVFAAGAGNAWLRERTGKSEQVMQLRPLHMVMVRGELPTLNGHCVDGARTRVTVTSGRDQKGRTVWQLGGQLAEDGVHMSQEELILHAQKELKAVLPRLDLRGTQWSSYRVDRAERATPGRRRPAAHQILQEGNCLTVWPTKLVLAPQLAVDVIKRLGTPEKQSPRKTEKLLDTLTNWPRPAVAPPPWEQQKTWFDFGSKTPRPFNEKLEKAA